MRKNKISRHCGILDKNLIESNETIGKVSFFGGSATRAYRLKSKFKKSQVSTPAIKTQCCRVLQLREVKATNT